MVFAALLILGSAAKGAAVAERPSAPKPALLTCTARNLPDGKDRRCHVNIPASATIRACAAQERAAGHCGAHPKGELVAWIAATGSAQCRIVKKKTDWTKRLTIKAAKATKPGAGTCSLSVGIR